MAGERANRTPTAGMKLAIPCACASGHLYYRESGTTTECPYCLQRQLTAAQDDLRRIRQTLRELI